MAADLHDCQQVNPGPTHVYDGRMPEIMKTEVCDPCRLESPLQRENRLTTV
jgi:hypothetical protein